MDKSAMANMESKLRDYFNKDKRMRVLNTKLSILKKQIDEIEWKLKNVAVELPEESRSMTYEERVQTSPTGESYAERILLRITDKLIQKKYWKRNKDWQIGIKFNMSQGAVTERRHRLIKNIANWEPWIIGRLNQHPKFYDRKMWQE